jgi:hypothetical protein
VPAFTFGHSPKDRRALRITFARRERFVGDARLDLPAPRRQQTRDRVVLVRL